MKTGERGVELERGGAMNARGESEVPSKSMTIKSMSEVSSENDNSFESKRKAKEIRVKSQFPSFNENCYPNQLLY